jgi:hypothetical protein
VGEASVFGFEILLRSLERLCVQKPGWSIVLLRGGCTLSVGREVKMEIPIETLFDLVLFPIQDLLKQKHGESWPKRDRETLEI